MHCFFNHPVALPYRQQIKVTDGMIVLPLTPYFTLNLFGFVFNCLFFPPTQRLFIAEKSEGIPGFIRVREMSGKFKFFQGQGIVREFYVVSVKNGYLL